MEKVQGEIVGKNELPSLDMSAYKSTKFSDESFGDVDAMQYEMHNTLATQYPGMTASEYRLMIAGEVCVYNINKIARFTEAEIEAGIMVSAPIRHVAKLMGFDVSAEKNDKNYYNTMRTVAPMLRSRTNLIESDGSFVAYGPLDMVLYNPNNDGNIYFKYSPYYSRRIVNNSDHYAIQSLLAEQIIMDKGNFNCLRLYEVLNSHAYSVSKSPAGKLQFYYDLIDLKCKIGLIKTTDPSVVKILKDPAFAECSTARGKVAYDRKARIEQLDRVSREALRNYARSEEYKRISRCSEEEAKVLREHYRKLSEGIISQYNEFYDFEKYILQDAQLSLMVCYKENKSIINYMFNYEPVRYKKSVIGITFTVYTVEAYMEYLKSIGDEERLSYFVNATDSQDISVMSVEARKVDSIPEDTHIRGKRKSKKAVQEETINLFDQYLRSLPEDQKISLGTLDIMNICKAGDFETIKRNYELMLRTEGIKDVVPWLIAAIKNDYAGHETQPGPKKAKTFAAGEQSDYDMDDLEQALMANKKGKK